jgi:hypothetical protein
MFAGKTSSGPFAIASPLSCSDLFKTAHIAVGSLSLMLKAMRDSRELVAALVH